MIGNNNMVNQQDFQRLQSVFQQNGSFLIGFGWECQTAGMIVGQNYGGGIAADGNFCRLSKRNGSGINTSGVEQSAGQNLALGIQAENIDQLFRCTKEVGEQILTAGLGGGKTNAFIIAGQQISPGKRRDKMQQDCGVVADSAYGLQFRQRRFQYSRNAAKMFQQLSGKIVGVFSGKCIKQE